MELNAIIETNVRAALEEDVGRGDLTAQLIDPDMQATAFVISREPAVIAGRDWFSRCFLALNSCVTIEWKCEDGQRVEADRILCEIKGPARVLLTAERCALNFLQTLSSVSTVTRQYVDAVAGTGTLIMDTRKTLPGLRDAQKYAVRAGGGTNQRRGLDDAILIKENHIAAAGGVSAVFRRACNFADTARIQIEVETLAELDEAIAAGAQLILLDNFDLKTLREAVQRCSGRAILEASGNVTLENVRAVAETGVQRISVGALTKTVRAIDLSMRITLTHQA